MDHDATLPERAVLAKAVWKFVIPLLLREGGTVPVGPVWFLIDVVGLVCGHGCRLSHETLLVAVDDSRTLVEGVASAGAEGPVRDRRCCRDANHEPGGVVVASLWSKVSLISYHALTAHEGVMALVLPPY